MRKPGSCTPGCGSNISAKWCGKNSSSIGAPGLLKVQRQNKDARIIRFTLCGAAGCVRGAGQQGCILSHSPSSSFAGAWQPGVSGGRQSLSAVGACCMRSEWHSLHLNSVQMCLLSALASALLFETSARQQSTSSEQGWEPAQMHQSYSTNPDMKHPGSLCYLLMFVHAAHRCCSPFLDSRLPLPAHTTSHGW